jgi:2-polyprenyl-6-methoxyphenol hydroxylase-like FAD-dependent oxidoreductase
MAPMKTISIAGGGLAGLTLGLALRRRGVPVVLREAGSYPRHRVCGEFLNGAGRDVLALLGGEDVLARARPQTSTAWFFRERHIYDAKLPAPAWGISRFTLDDTLQRAFVAAGGELREHSRQAAEAGPGRVWCGGRIPGRSPWIGLKCHVPGLPLGADLEMHLAKNGYVGLTRVEDDTVNICGLFRRDSSLRTLPDYLRKGGLAELAGRVEAGRPDPGSKAAVAGFSTGWQNPRPGLLTVGDACGMIPPFTGNGMSMACEGAWEASEPLADFASGRIDWDLACHEVGRRQRARFATRLRLGQFLHPFLTAPAGQSLLAAMSRLRLLPFGPVFHLLR